MNNLGGKKRIIIPTLYIFKLLFVAMKARNVGAFVPKHKLVAENYTFVDVTGVPGEWECIVHPKYFPP